MSVIFNAMKSVINVHVENAEGGQDNLANEVKKATDAVASITVDPNMKVSEEGLENNVIVAQETIREFQDKQEINMESRNNVKISRKIPQHVLESYLIHPSITHIGSKKDKEKFLKKNRETTIAGLNAIAEYLK